MRTFEVDDLFNLSRTWEWTHKVQPAISAVSSFPVTEKVLSPLCIKDASQRMSSW